MSANLTRGSKRNASVRARGGSDAPMPSGVSDGVQSRKPSGRAAAYALSASQIIWRLAFLGSGDHVFESIDPATSM